MITATLIKENIYFGMIMCFFVSEFVYIVDYFDGFPYIKPSLHPWNETYLVRMDDCFDVFWIWLVEMP